MFAGKVELSTTREPIENVLTKNNVAYQLRRLFFLSTNSYIL